MSDANPIAAALDRNLTSPNVSDSNFEAANVVDALTYVANAGNLIASAITPRDASPGTDAAGGRVGTLTEATMGITAGLMRIAEALDGLADAVWSHGGDPK